jgi:hypothetical protein
VKERDMDWKEALKARFVDAIRQVYPAPTPLIGEKWFYFPPAGVSRAAAAQSGSARPPDFQFLGVRKLAKATGIPVDKVVKHLIRQLNFRRVDARVEIEEEWKINVWLAREGVVPRAASEAEAPEGEQEEKRK